MIEAACELQISVNIGQKKYLIKVPKSSDLSNLITDFLKSNNLNPKYYESIMKLVQQQLSDSFSQQIQQPKQQQISSLGNRFSSEHSQGNKKQQMLGKIMQEIKQKNESDTKQVYQKWKQLEKQKQKNQKVDQTKTPKKQDQSQLQGKNLPQRHSPDHFYKKGQHFKETLFNNRQTQFHKHYPFKIHQKKQSNYHEQQELTKRLVKQKKNNAKIYLTKTFQSAQPTTTSKKDPIKQHLRQQDQLIDIELYQMIQNRKLSQNKVRPVSKSPFRKTRVF